MDPSIATAPAAIAAQDRALTKSRRPTYDDQQSQVKC